jgi:putative spermidine/putrescine transport system permease protein
MASAVRHQSLARERQAPALTASLLLGPATLMVALGLLLPVLILFRYSFNKFEPRVMMVEALTLDNYVKFFTDPFYTNVFWTTLRVALITRRSASSGFSPRLRARPHREPLQATCC